MAKNSTNDAVLTRDAILGNTYMPTARMHVPEWGGDVILKGFSARERDAFEASIQEVDKRGRSRLSLENFRARLVVRGIVDHLGKRMFRDSDADALGEQSAAVVSRLANKLQELNGITADDVDELVKNSEATPAVASDSSSHSPSAEPLPN